ncbi:Sec-independent protein translocase protein TatA [Photobacterium damselae subsp. piscicida]|uniref:Sec-independent protein translocase protein TatA n=1 Tax=Photobacterium damsela subsp. piscicida TaxID=38294 RepID=A0AAD1CK04_PHODP|nr:twin-arginine translocase TatA/TatE family subunit [Photobacterium damselae]BAX55035.1 Sec-independent protein translocase protein TatA [Photobacterium damselae subsp. piscicida]
MGGISVAQLLIIGVICVLVFGTKKSRTVGSDLGYALKSFQKAVVTPIDLLMVKFTFYKRSNNLIVHLFAFRKTNGFSY